MTDNERLKKINDLSKKFLKSYGETIVTQPTKCERAISSSFSINYVLGGGCVLGRTFEIYGENSNGKSLFSTILMKDVQRVGKAICVLDYENTLDYSFLQKQGVDISPEMFMCLNPESLEDGFDIVEELANSDQFGLVIVDSTNSAPSRSEVNSDYGASNMGAQAKIFSQSLKKITSLLSRKKLSLCFISQTREKCGVVFGSPRVIGVGKSIAFYASMRIGVKREEFLEDKNKKTVGIRFKIDTNLKNKTFPPRREAYINCFYEAGHDKYVEYVDFGIKYDVIKKAGSWFSYIKDGEEIKIGQGKNCVLDWLKANEDLADEVYMKICDRMGKEENIDFNLNLKTCEKKEETKEIEAKK